MEKATAKNAEKGKTSCVLLNTNAPIRANFLQCDLDIDTKEKILTQRIYM